MNVPEIILVVEPAVTVLGLGGAFLVKITKLTEAVKIGSKSLEKIAEGIEDHEHRITILEVRSEKSENRRSENRR